MRGDGYTAAQKLAALQREVRLRKRVYPRLVSEDRMKLSQAEYEIDIFEAMVADYEIVAAKDRLI